jgi:hypothetical protein
MAAEVAAAWSGWVLAQPSVTPVTPPVPASAPGLAAVGGQVVRSLALVAASINHAGLGISQTQLIAFARPLVVWAEGDSASFAVLVIKGDPMPLTVDSANAQAVLSFEDDHKDAVGAPAGAQSTATSDNPAVLTVGAAAAGTDVDGNATIVFSLTAVAKGTANLSVVTTDAGGKPLLGPDGVTPIADPAPVVVTVNPGAAASEQFAVPGN